MDGTARNRDGRARLIVGFDGGCFTCSNVARRVEEAAGGRLGVRSLGDPEVEGWRTRCLGDDAPWAPTLFEVAGTRVRAWTGWRMGLALSRHLGPVRTWRILQILGGFGPVPGAARTRAAGAFSGLTRGQFLRGLGGGLVAASVLAGAGPFANAARARGWVHPFDRVRFLGKRDLHGAARRRALEAALASPDVANVQRGPAQAPRDVTAARHTLGDGNALTAVSWTVDEATIVVHYELSQPIGNFRTQAMRIEAVPGEEFVTTAESVNGKLRPEAASRADGAPPGALATRSCGCKRWRWTCVARVAATVCLACGGTCAACVVTPAKWACISCLSCLLVGCPAATRSCCRRW